jgi:tetratricopeptide (TPR) repeat protein
MNTRTAILGVAVIAAAGAVAAAAGAAAWLVWGVGQPSAAASETAPPLPIPPVPPRIAQGEQYEGCLEMLTYDPPGAATFAESWQANGGGEGATHCLALARIALGQDDSGAQMLEALAASSHAPEAARAAIYGQAAQAWEEMGNIPRALAAATLALALSPDDPDLLVDRAVAAGNIDRYQDAIDDLTHALDIDPKRLDAMVLRGTAWRHLGRLELAQDDIDRVLIVDPDHAEALLERGILRQRRNDRDGARDDWERAASLAPDSATADLAQQNLALLEAGPERQ